MNTDFEEEKNRLEKTEEKIDNIIRNDKEVIKILKNRKQKVVGDFQNIDDIVMILTKIQDKSKNIQFLIDTKSCPYYARIDLEYKKDGKWIEEPFYIGENTVIDGTDVLVTGWYTEIGDILSRTTETVFNNGDVEKELTLRRRMHIKDAKLLACKTEYERGEITLQGEIVDPFLVTVMKDKRREKKLTNIISTIQQNQNTIIRHPIKDSFIVQGCAGSGKTMILLHRLSYLGHNKMYKSPEKIKIITPNEAFKGHIAELSRNLKIEEIEVLSVEQFYVSLIKTFFPKSAADSIVESEKTMNPQLLSDIYSLDFVKSSKEEYDKYWHDTIRRVKELDIETYMEELGFKIDLSAPHTYNSYLRIKENIELAINKCNSINERVLEQKRRKDIIEEEISKKQEQKKTLENKMEEEIAETIDKLNDNISKENEKKRERELEISALELTIKEKKAKISAWSSDVKAYEKRRGAIAELKENRIDIKTIINNRDEISKFIVGNFNEEFEEYKTALENLARTPVFNFTKRNVIKRRITQIEGELKQKSEQLLNEEEIVIIQTINESKKSIEDLKHILETENNQLASKKKIHKAENSTLLALKEVLRVFKDTVLPDLQKEISGNYLYKVKDIVENYVMLHRERKMCKRNINQLENSAKEISQSMDALIVSTTSAENIRRMIQAGRIIEELNPSNLFRCTSYKKMKEIYTKQKEVYSKKNYRHKLYVRILFSSFYFSKESNLPIFINIDEAQDLSVAEYIALKELLGEKAIFNLYGDVNQLVYDYKGISDWDDLKNVITDNIFVLNENYRNAREITQFCNEEFDAEILEIGINGGLVKKLSLEEAIQNIIEESVCRPENRIAILYKTGLEHEKEKFISLIKKYSVQNNEIIEKLSILTVESVKGLEFDTVAVITSEMTNNEKYIAYTRALDTLIIV